jgi:peptidoglycan/xylan/chitin deacetylase (PgdA/CDA1 family)
VLSPLIGSVHAVSTDAPLVALTIDDGPDAHWTEPVLRVLEDAGAHATFFMLVERAEAHPDLVHRVVDAGHEIGLHGIDHTALPRCPHPIEGVLAEGMARLESVSGRRPVWFRPPFGSQTLGSYQATRRVGLDVVVWGAEGADWELCDPGEIAARIAGVAHAGDIVLLHDGLSPEPPPGHPVATLDRAAAVAATVSRLATAGLGCTSLGDLVASGRPRRSVWFRPPSD